MTGSDYIGKELYAIECFNVKCRNCRVLSPHSFFVKEEKYKIINYEEIPKGCDNKVYKLFITESCMIPIQNLGKRFFLTLEEAQEECDRLNETIKQNLEVGDYS